MQQARRTATILGVALASLAASPLTPPAPAEPPVVGRSAPSGSTAHGDTAAPDVRPNDNTGAGGALRNGTLVIALEAREGLWRPEGADGPAVRVFAFGESGRALSAPGPLIRVRAGTKIEATVHNRLARPLVVFGLQRRPVAVPVGAQAVTGVDSLLLEPGAKRTVRFDAGEPGTYYYHARTRPPMGRGPIGPSHPGGDGGDGPLVGAFIVDSAASAGAPPVDPRERIFIITKWADAAIDSTSMGPAGSKITVNGLSWPHTERLRYSEGDTVRWRVINATAIAHPMHLHGFFFRVDARGTIAGDTIYPAERQRRAVTELLHGTGTMAMTWVPEREGNWLFHCHLVRHMAPTQRLGGFKPAAQTQHATNHATELMAGLVLGIEIAPRAASAEIRPDPQRRRPIRLFASTRARVNGEEPGFGFTLQEGTEPPARDSVRVPGAPLLLRRDEPVAITVRNQLPTALAVHWHGMELESYFDGVGGWSGKRGRVAPPIAPDDSFVVHMTPPRAGTFIYHTHGEHSNELVSGLYAPLLVLEPGEAYDAETDHTLLLSAGSPGVGAPPLLNGAADPAPLQLRAGTRHRLRFIQISADDVKAVELRQGDRIVEWVPRAKDGDDLPPAQRTAVPARFAFGPGETLDFDFTTGAPGRFVLRIETTFYPAARRPPSVMEVAVEVRE